MIVVDSNIIAARNLTSVLSAKAEQVEEKDPGWIVPVLWRYEFQNMLATAIKSRIPKTLSQTSIPSLTRGANELLLWPLIPEQER